MKIITVCMILAMAFTFSHASDPSPLQDFCVAIDDPKNALFVNGKFCKNPNLVSADDFLYRGLNKAGNTENPLGSVVTAVNVAQLKGLNTLGISAARIDFAPYGLNPPHTHPRATEGLIHFQQNVGNTNAIAFAGLSSQNPGVITIANAVFGSDPKISVDVLKKAFQVEENLINYLQSQFWWDNN
ncbi:germin-like protein subfamily 1 member 13 [Impatiens glandulifera]|uniref:germin-like protein subfamily 1 member 13 n=1 Tax=Impatiens glandulifera TaxID=253017 RepID=UPI001FB17DEE|nr:germin-like protein subfamily 1 member 13 [Impatiens glandulifera]